MPDGEHEERLFNRQEAENLLPLLERLLTDVIEKKKQLEAIDHEFHQLQTRIQLSGGIIPPYSFMVEKKQEREKYVSAIRDAISRIEGTGCVVKDLDMGLIDFPSIISEEQVFLCWRLGEEGIRYWHRPEEGFAGRKPLTASDASSPDASKPN